MRRDTIFYQIFQRHPALFFELIGQRPEDAQRYQFTSVEVKEPTFRIDGVLMPPADALFKRIFFTEVQMQSDKWLYHRFFGELFLYLYRNRGTYDDWHGTLIFPSRSYAPDDDQTHRALLTSNQVQCTYIEELGDAETLPLGLALIKLMVESEAQTLPVSKRLIERAKQQSEPFPPLQDIIELVTTIAIYRLTSLSREDIEAMLDLTIKKTRVYNEIKEEGREEGREEGEITRAITVAKKLLMTPMNSQEIAQITELPLEQVLQLQEQSDDA